MSDDSYPLLSVSHLARRVQNSEVSEIRRDWTGNDESARNHHERVDLSESPLRLRLSWKRSPKDPVHLIGVYELDLWQLLTARYARIEPKTQNEIRLRFYHGYDDLIYIQVNSKEPGLPIGRMPSYPYTSQELIAMTNMKHAQQRRTVWALFGLLGLMTPLTYVCQWLIFKPSWPNFALSVLIGTCMTLVGGFAALLVSPYGAADQERLSKVSATIFTLVTGYVLAKIIDPLVAQIIGNNTAALSVPKGANLLIALIGFLAGFLGTYVFRAYLGTSLFRDELSGDNQTPEIRTADIKVLAPLGEKPAEMSMPTTTKAEAPKGE